MTDLIIGEDGIFGPDLKARTEHEASIDVFRSRGGTGRRALPAPQVTELRSGDVVEGDGWRVTTGSVVHVQPYLVCYGFRLDSDEGSFAYSGDTGPCTAMEKLSDGVDVLVHMCPYLTGTEPSPEYAKGCMGHLELARLGETAKVRNLVVSHTLSRMEAPGVKEQVIREMAEIYGGNLFFGEDLMEIPVTDPQLTKMD